MAAGTPDLRVGLCAQCRHARQHRSSRGSAFWLCGRAGIDPGFPKYPRLPVFACDGYARGAPEPITEQTSDEPWEPPEG